MGSFVTTSTIVLQPRRSESSESVEEWFNTKQKNIFCTGAGEKAPQKPLKFEDICFNRKLNHL